MANDKLGTRARGAKAAAQRGRQEITSAILGTLLWKHEAEEMAADLRAAAAACDQLAAKLPARPAQPERVVSVMDYLEHTSDNVEPVERPESFEGYPRSQ